MNLKHSLTNIDYTKMVGDCFICGPSVRIRKSYKSKNTGTQFYRCYTKFIVTKTQIERPWALHKKDTCERCGFIPVDDCQLTVDHIDGNRYNNEISNFMTLCHNCHALKSLRNNDHVNRYSLPILDA